MFKIFAHILVTPCLKLEGRKNIGTASSSLSLLGEKAVAASASFAFLMHIWGSHISTVAHWSNFECIW